ncbi:MAG: CvpA family protein [Spirochaetaceae bacterium]|jgi:uncharacterized membrane protein required for colicin V production|nr:CvpA family protein [Spirochaetaceae bacterium]
MTLGLLDYIYFGMLALAILLGIMRGAVKEGYALSARILSFLAALVLSLSLGDYLGPRITLFHLGYLIPFILIYLTVSLILLWIMSRILRKEKKHSLPMVSRLAGALLGLFSGGFFILLCNWILMLQNWFDLESHFLVVSYFFTRVAQFLLVFAGYYG